MRRVVPDDVAGRVKVKVVYTVLEAQYQSALTAGEAPGGGKGALARGVARAQGWYGCGGGRRVFGFQSRRAAGVSPAARATSGRRRRAAR
jgi:hypothetical protein